MMHGYLPFDKEDNLLVPFRTWRNTITGEASGMFPIDSKTRDYDAAMLDKFAALDKVKEYPWDIRDILPKVLTAGEKALTADKDCGGLVAFNLFSGEPVIGLNEGRPMFARKPDARMNLANFMRTHLYASLATLKIGCDILFKEEKVKVDTLYGHGGPCAPPLCGSYSP